MADTSFIKTDIEPFVIKSLANKYGHPFKRRFLTVGIKHDGTPRRHEFSAVSEEGSVVATIRFSSGLTSGGKRPVAKINSAFKDLYFLSLVDAQHKLLVVTDPEFYGILEKTLEGLLPARTALVHIPLSPEMQKKVDSLKGRTD